MSWRSHNSANLRQCCNAAFCLKHAVSINYAGKTVLVLFGVGVAASPGASPLLRGVSAVNAMLMALGQYWFSIWWDGEARVQAFVDPVTNEAHSLHCMGRCPGALLLIAAFYYATFSLLFSIAVFLDDSTDDIYYVYAVGASVWHGWCGAILLLSSLLHWWGLKTPSTPVDHKHVDDAGLEPCMQVPSQAYAQKASKLPQHVTVPLRAYGSFAGHDASGQHGCGSCTRAAGVSAPSRGMFRFDHHLV